MVQRIPTSVIRTVRRRIYTTTAGTMTHVDDPHVGLGICSSTSTRTRRSRSGRSLADRILLRLGGRRGWSDGEQGFSLEDTAEILRMGRWSGVRPLEGDGGDGGQVGDSVSEDGVDALSRGE